MNALLAKGPPKGLPRAVTILRIVIVVLSVVILALAAYAISIFGSWSGYVGGYSGVSGLLTFVVIKTWLIFGILQLLELRFPHVYLRIVAVVLYALSIIFWLSAWAWSASIASFWLSSWSSYCAYGVCSDTSSYAKREGGSLAACAGLGALVWVLAIVHLVLFVRGCLADKPADTELGRVAKNNNNNNNVPVYPPQPAYQ